MGHQFFGSRKSKPPASRRSETVTKPNSMAHTIDQKFHKPPAQEQVFESYGKIYLNQEQKIQQFLKHGKKHIVDIK